MRISDTGLNLIKLSEGFVATVYKDQAGKPTIGYGHLLTAADRRSKRFVGKRLTPEEAEDLLREDVAAAEAVVTSLIRVPLTQGQFDALADFAFNLGSVNLANSTLLKRLNAGDYAAVPRELARWVKIHNPKTGEPEISPGLAKRRKREIELWLSAA